MNGTSGTSDTYVDPAHGVPLPRGRSLHQILSLVLDRQRLAVNEWMRTLKRMPRKAPSLNHWTQPITDATAPVIAAYQRQGARQFLYAVLQQLKRARRENAGKSIGLGTGTSVGRVSRLRLRSPMEPTTIEEILADAFLVFNTEVADAARTAAWNFAASTNATSLKASAGTLYQLYAVNLNAAVRYIKFYNKASAPTVGTDTPVATFPIPASATGAGFQINFDPGFDFSTGIAYATTTGVADSDTAAVAANEIIVVGVYV